MTEPTLIETKMVLAHRWSMDRHAYGYLPTLSKATARIREALSDPHWGKENEDWFLIGGSYGDLNVYFTSASNAIQFKLSWTIDE